VLADVLGWLRCPHCAAELRSAGGSLRCGRGHAFDIARQGYVNLSAGGGRTGTGDTAPMLAARDAFLAAGHFDPLAEALAGEAAHAAGDGCVIDLGAGTGRQLARVLDALPGRHGVALDVSKHALRRAARAHPRIGAVGCDIWASLPLRDRVAGLALNVFAPRNGAELARVLAPGGLLVVVTPTARHLEELAAPLGLLSVDSRKRERLERELGNRFRMLRDVRHDWEMDLSQGDLRAVATMGPSSVHVEPASLEERMTALPERVRVRASMTVTAWERP
jgi:23S rRNA (guanine745-N1)-methyltransferase